MLEIIWYKIQFSFWSSFWCFVVDAYQSYGLTLIRRIVSLGLMTGLIHQYFKSR